VYFGVNAGKREKYNCENQCGVYLDRLVLRAASQVVKWHIKM